jgi:hypothetical protein
MERDMNEREHEELRSSLGVFVLNAAPPPEMQRLEQHVAYCAECAYEVRLLREAATELAWLPPPQDADELIERISSSLPPRPRRIATRMAVAAAAVAVAVAGLAGTALVRERGRNGDLVGVVATAERTVRLAAEKGFGGRGSLYLARERAVLVLDAMPDPGRGRAYQLWAITGAKPHSMTVVGGHRRIDHVFVWTGHADRFAITIEPMGGSPVPTSDPVLAGG